MQGTAFAQPAHVEFCFDVLVAHLAGEESDVHPGFAEAYCPLFVSWSKQSRRGDMRLRGCIGTLEPRHLQAALQEYALISALRDRRFSPVQPRELPMLQCTVSLLHSFEVAPHWQAWSPGMHGLIIDFADPITRARRSATFLPEVAAQEGWTQVETIDALVRKSGFVGQVDSTLRSSLRITRYQSTAQALSYAEWQAKRSAAGTALDETLDPRVAIPVIA